MAPYLYHTIDPNICLYRGYIISVTFMNDDLLDDFDLQPICEKKSSACFNTLRFTDIANSSRIFGPNEKFPGIDNQVNCKSFVYASSSKITNM